MLKSSRNLRTLLFGAVIALMVGLLGPTSSAVAANPVTLSASITGTAAVGETLTAVASSVNPGNANLTYKWQTLDPVTDIAGATSSTYVLTPAELGKQVQVVITGTANNRDPGVSTSAPTSAVINGFSGTPVVTISDTTPVVDSPVTASLSGEDPPATTVTYQWFLGANAINGATNASYTPVATDVGKTLTAKATAMKDGYLTKTFSSAATSNVAKADFTSPPIVTIAGTPMVDEVLTASASGEVPAGTGSYTYKWYADGSSIGGANAQTFTPGANQVGKKITVEATATKAGYNSITGTSAETAPVALASFSVAPTVELSTTAPKVGDVLTATPSGEVPTATEYAYQWYRISALGVKSAMVGEIGQTYTVTPGNLNYKLQAKATAIKPGYNNRSASSVQTARVNQITLSKATVARGSTITVTAAHLRSGQVYRIFVDGVTVYKGNVPSSGTVSRTITVPKTTAVGTQPFRVSGYTSAGVRDFTVVTSIPVT